MTVDGKIHAVVRSDSQSVPSASNGTQTNFNHAEQKLFGYIQDNYGGQQANVNIAVQNTSGSNPGMCAGCNMTSSSFAISNSSFNVNIYQGTTGVNP